MSEEMSFKFSEARSLPVILLLDTSGSMEASGNINVLNSAVREMLQDFASQDNGRVVIKVAIITFGGSDAQQFLPLKPAKEALDGYKDMQAQGMTPLGGALNLAKSRLIEDKSVILSRDYRPTIILVSDGNPNDNWQDALHSFITTGRSAKCYRMAMGIGQLPKEAQDVLKKFVSDEEMIFYAEDSRKIKNFFKTVAISTISRTVSSNPNIVGSVLPADDEYDPDDDVPF